MEKNNKQMQMLQFLTHVQVKLHQNYLPFNETRTPLRYLCTRKCIEESGTVARDEFALRHLVLAFSNVAFSEWNVKHHLALACSKQLSIAATSVKAKDKKQNTNMFRNIIDGRKL